jgi:hypothetical protein
VLRLRLGRHGWSSCRGRYGVDERKEMLSAFVGGFTDPDLWRMMGAWSAALVLLGGIFGLVCVAIIAIGWMREKKG